MGTQILRLGDREHSQTGYFGIPGDQTMKGCTKVHFVRVSTTGKDWKPICGAKLRPEMVFQFCSDGFCVDYVECGSCKKAAKIHKCPECGHVGMKK